MKKLTKIFIMICTVLTCSGCQKTDNTNIYKNVLSIFDYGKNVYMPYLWDVRKSIDMEGREMGAVQENGDYVNYWGMSNVTINNLYYYQSDKKDERLLNEAIEIMSGLMDTFYNYGYFPRPIYKSLEYGWVSSMDAPNIMLASLMLYEITNETKYKEFIDDLKMYN